MRIAIESPYAPKFLDKHTDPLTYQAVVAANERFARAACKYAVSQGHSPYAMHLLFTQFLDDTIPKERDLGIACGLEWTGMSEEIWFCLRPGEFLSSGMIMAVVFNLLNRPDRKMRLMRFFADGSFKEEEQIDWKTAAVKAQ